MVARDVGMVFLRPLEGTGHKPFLVEFPEVYTVCYVPDLRHHIIKGLAIQRLIPFLSNFMVTVPKLCPRKLKFF